MKLLDFAVIARCGAVIDLCRLVDGLDVVRVPTRPAGPGRPDRVAAPVRGKSFSFFLGASPHACRFQTGIRVASR